MPEHTVTLIIALIGALPGIAALLQRQSTVNKRAERVAAETTTTQFSLLYEEARKQVIDCRHECTTLRDDLKAARIREKALEIQVHQLEDRQDVLEADVARLQSENTHLANLVKRLGSS